MFLTTERRARPSLIGLLLVTVLALLSSCRPTALAAQSCITPEPRLVVTGGAYYVVRVDGDSISAHTSVFAASARAVQAWLADPARSVRIHPPAGLIRVEGCVPSGTLVPPPAPPPPVDTTTPPPPPPAAPVYEILLFAGNPPAGDVQTLTIAVQRISDGRRELDRAVRWLSESGSGIGSPPLPDVTLSTGTGGHVFASWTTVPGVVNRVRLRTDSAAELVVIRDRTGEAWLVDLNVTEGDPMGVVFSWPWLGPDSVYVSVIGGAPLEPRTAVLAPGSQSHEVFLPYDPAWIMAGGGRDVWWKVRACVGALPAVQAGKPVTCAQRMLPVSGSNE